MPKLKYIRNVVTLQLNPAAVHRLRDVRQCLSPRRIRDGRQESPDRQPRRLHGVRRMRAELPNDSHLSPCGRRLRDGHHHGGNSWHGTDLRLLGQHI